MDISDRKFERAARGYRCEEVEAFLKDVALAYASLLKDNHESENKILKLVDKINEYRDDEDAIKSAILGAQKQGNLIVSEAEMKAKTIISEASEKSEKMDDQTRDQYQDELNKLNALKIEVSAFKAQLTELFNKQLRLIMEIPEVEDEQGEADFAENVMSENNNSDASSYYNLTDYASAVSNDVPVSPYSAEAYFGKNVSDEASSSSDFQSGKDFYSSNESRYTDLKFGNNSTK
jgi:cell division initiation protein